jgi:hypothetical protein
MYPPASADGDCSYPFCQSGQRVPGSTARQRPVVGKGSYDLPVAVAGSGHPWKATVMFVWRT